MPADPAGQARQQIAEALARIAAKGLGGESDVLFSVRIPGENAMAVSTGAGAEIVTLDSTSMLHAAVYRLRGDAGAILTAMQPWASRLEQLSAPMPAIFDEQVRQLGQRVERLQAAGAKLSNAGVSALKRGACAFLAPDGVITIGFNPERAILNAELLEKCAKAYILASLTGCKVGTIPWLVRYIASGRLRKDQARAAESYARGEVPQGFSTY